MTYSELVIKLRQIEKETGIYLSDTCVDVENAGKGATDTQLFRAAVNAAGIRAEDAGYDINELFGATIY